jgi:hypothetical protein
MKKITLFVLTLLGVSFFASAQAYEGTVKMKVSDKMFNNKKEEESALIMVYNYPADVVENALKAKLADRRLRADKSKGAIYYGSSVINDINAAPLDYYFKTDEDGKKGKEKTTLYLIMKGDVADPASTAANAKSFLEHLVPDVERTNIIMQIKAQEEILTKEEKKLNDLKSDHEKLDKKLKDNERDQDKQQKVIISQQSILDDLKAKQQ